MLTKKKIKELLKEFFEKTDLSDIGSQEDISIFTQENEHELNFSCSYMNGEYESYTTAGFSSIIKDKNNRKIFLYTIFDWEALASVYTDIYRNEINKLEEITNIIYSLQKRSIEIKKLINK